MSTGWGWHPRHSVRVGDSGQAGSGGAQAATKRSSARRTPVTTEDGLRSHLAGPATDGERSEELLEHHPALQAGQGRAQAEVVALSEGEVGVGVRGPRRRPPASGRRRPRRGWRRRTA